MSEGLTEVMEPVPGEPPKKPKGDLGVRTVSAIAMVVLTGVVFWIDGWTLLAFVAAIGIGLLWEFWNLVRRFVPSLLGRILWMIFGIVYIGLAIITILNLTLPIFGWALLLAIIGSVIATDVGAYFAGRSIGGPKIAPRISPSKTWAGLVGGAICSSIAFPAIYRLPADAPSAQMVGSIWIVGAGIAVISQAGDFFESWMKRRAGVKDSGSLIPGHGGLFDRVDGLIAVLFVAGLIYLYAGS
jgi:phosphatidate cytidylyltransferase